MNSENHVKVAIVGSGPAGIGAAIGLARRGVGPIVLIERSYEIGGIPARYKAKNGRIRTIVSWKRGHVIFGQNFVNRLQRKLDKTDVQIWIESQVIKIDPDKRKLTLVNPREGKFHITADAIILACGAREKTMAERGWIAGSRSARVFFANHLLDLIDRHDILPSHNSAIIGSDLLAYSAAAKLKKAGASELTMIDTSHKPKCSFLERLYFKRWIHPKWRGLVKSAKIISTDSMEIITSPDNRRISCDGIFVSGELVPNTELAILGSLKVELSSRKLIVKSEFQLSTNGWFAVGNMLGGSRGAEWCYFNGLNCAKSVVKHLSE